MKYYNSPYWTLKSTLIGSLSIKSITCLQWIRFSKWLPQVVKTSVTAAFTYYSQLSLNTHFYWTDTYSVQLVPAILHSFPYCTIQKHANSEVQKPPFTTAFFGAVNCNYDHKAVQLETWRHTKQIKISQSQITNHDLLNPSKKTTVSYEFR